MLRRHGPNPLKIASALALFVLTLLASSCGRSQASPPDDSDPVTKAIHDYGRNSSNRLAPRAPQKPMESPEHYDAYITSLLVQQRFPQLEKIAEQNRSEKGLLLGGVWKNYQFFTATAHPLANEDSAYQVRMNLLKEWVSAYPQSSAARISLAGLYDSYASFARGETAADLVTDSQWQLLHNRTALAVHALLDAAQLKERDAHWYAVMQAVSQNQSWSKSAMQDLLNQALAFEPDYYHFYRIHAQLLRPMWFGEPGEIQDFADETSSRLPEPNSSILYFQIMSSLACDCRWAVEDLSHASWPKLRQGYFSLTELYGDNNVIANRFAFMARTFRDKASAHEALTSISTVLPEVWTDKEAFEAARNWADSAQLSMVQ